MTRTCVMNWLMLVVSCVTVASSREKAFSPIRVTLMPASGEGAAARGAPGGAAGGGGAGGNRPERAVRGGRAGRRSGIFPRQLGGDVHPAGGGEDVRPLFRGRIGCARNRGRFLPVGGRGRRSVIPQGEITARGIPEGNGGNEEGHPHDGVKRRFLHPTPITRSKPSYFPPNRQGQSTSLPVPAGAARGHGGVSV